jgi:hypothetical protein
MAQNACSDARTCLLGVSLNEIFARNCHLISFLTSGPIKWTFMQAYAVQDRLLGLSRLCVFFQVSHRNNNGKTRIILQATQLEHVSINV